MKDIVFYFSPISNRGGKTSGFLIELYDYTELGESRRAIAWASMARKMAHDIKTPLSTVLLNAQRLQMEYNKDRVEKADVYNKYIDDIIEDVRNLRDLTKVFLKFARIDRPNLQREDINLIIEDLSIKLVQRLPDRIELRKELEAGLPEINLDRNQIEVALNNIFDNSITSIEGSGVITVSTYLEQNLHYSEKDRVVIEIIDTGKGISEENIKRIFEPDFSSTPGGSGLGMAIVKKIIDDHNGKIRVKSELGKGTIVTIELPVIQ